MASIPAMFIPDLREKLNIVDGVAGWRLPREALRAYKLREVLQVATSQTMSKKLSGQNSVSYWELSKLVQYCGLGPELDYRVFLTPDLDAFHAALKRAKVGTYGGGSEAEARKQFADIADQHMEDGRIALAFHKRKRQGELRCLGSNEAERPEAIFHFHERVAVKVQVPGDGHLVLATDYMHCEVTILKPSAAAPGTAVSSRSVRIPHDSTMHYFDIVPPGGPNRLLAIWTRVPLSSVWLDDIDDVAGGKFVPYRLVPGMFPELVAEVSALGAANYALAYRDYDVGRRSDNL
ncbi:MAG: hypothetical protein AAFQ42_08560 [Pseudomonadota bacterium]